MKNKQAFTLIELLVVVLIIGILAAVAVPQYQVAVGKSKYATLKNITLSITYAAQRFYLANGTLPQSFDELDIDIPGQAGDTVARFNDNTCTINLFPQYSLLITACRIYVSSGHVEFRSHFYANSSPIKNICATATTNKLGRKICEADSKSKGTASVGGAEMMYNLP